MEKPSVILRVLTTGLHSELLRGLHLEPPTGWHLVPMKGLNLASPTDQQRVLSKATSLD